MVDAVQKATKDGDGEQTVPGPGHNPLSGPPGAIDGVDLDDLDTRQLKEEWGKIIDDLATLVDAE
eukprot:m.79592 g.79592  ORF g.79592 m.79592 type:complete len:65 (+) comp10817_c0_seq1:723-917(+)